MPENERKGLLIKGKVTVQGLRPTPQRVDLRETYPECVTAYGVEFIEDHSVLVGPDGALANVLVYISGIPPDHIPSAALDPARLRRSRGEYEPRVLGLQVKRPLLIENADLLRHTNHVIARFQKQAGVSRHLEGAESLLFDNEEVFVRLVCDVHPWERAYVGVVPHPFFVVTGRDGSFEISADIPTGTYALRAAHEKLGVREQLLSISSPHETKEIAFLFHD